MQRQPDSGFLGILILAAAVGMAGCASSPPPSTAYGDVPPNTLTIERKQLVQFAHAQLGAPYRYGGNRPDGFDCSGLIEFTHRQAGIRVPRTTQSQWRQASPLDRPYLLPGDLLFFDLGSRKVRHVGIYTGDGNFIHAPSSGKTVSRASLDDPYWKQHWHGSRTFL